MAVHEEKVEPARIVNVDESISPANIGSRSRSYARNIRDIGEAHLPVVAVYRNDGKMSFTDVSYVSGIAPATTPYVGWGDGFIDIDNSGWLDFFLVNGHVYPQVDSLVAGAKYREPKLLYLNQHDGTFQDVSKLVGQAIQIPPVSRGVATGSLFN